MEIAVGRVISEGKALFRRKGGERELDGTWERGKRGILGGPRADSATKKN